MIPCYNEKKNIKELFNQIKKLEDQISLEIIIVNNGSIDSSEEEINLRKNIFKDVKIIDIKKNIGFGNGIKEGIRNSTCELICYTHGDLQFDLMNVFKAYSHYKSSSEKNKFVKGRRTKRSIIENFFTFFMSLINSILFRKILYDIHAQPNLFEKNLIDNINFLPDDMSIDLYLLLKAKNNNLKISRFDVEVSKRKFGVGANDQLIRKFKYSLLSLFNSFKMLFHGRF